MIIKISITLPLLKNKNIMQLQKYIFNTYNNQ